MQFLAEALPAMTSHAASSKQARQSIPDVDTLQEVGTRAVHIQASCRFAMKRRASEVTAGTENHPISVGLQASLGFRLGCSKGLL